MTDEIRKTLAEREARIARLEERNAGCTAELAAARDECRRLADALADCQAELQAWATATYNDTPASLAESVAASVIEVVELRALNERLLADAKRLTAALQQVEAVREAGIREAVVAERDARAERLADALRATKVWLSSPRYFSVNYAVAEQERDDALVRIAAALADSPPAVEPRTITSEADAMVAVLREARQAMKRLKPSTHLGRPERHAIIGRIDAVLEAHHGKAEPPKSPFTAEVLAEAKAEVESWPEYKRRAAARARVSPEAAAGGEQASGTPDGSPSQGPISAAHTRAAEGSQHYFIKDKCVHCGVVDDGTASLGCEPAPEVTAAAREPLARLRAALDLSPDDAALLSDEEAEAFEELRKYATQLLGGAPQAAAQPVRDTLDYAGELAITLTKERDEARAEAAELQRSFDLRWEAGQRAIDRWRTAAPGRELTRPDHADLCVFLLDEVERLSTAPRVAQPVRDEDHVRKLEQFRSVVVQALEVLDG